MAADLIGPLLGRVLDEAYSVLDPKPSRKALYSGSQVAWDDCCEGQVWVRLVAMEPVTGDPRQNRAMGPCGVLMWRATIGVGILRCAAVLNDDGSAPSPTVLTAETLTMTSDMSALAQAISCSIPTNIKGLMKMQVIRWDPLGPDGGCVGGEWTVQALVNTCKCD